MAVKRLISSLDYSRALWPDGEHAPERLGGEAGGEPEVEVD